MSLLHKLHGQKYGIGGRKATKKQAVAKFLLRRM